MKVERIAKDKVRIFVSYDDLEERGIDRDEIWQNGRKVQELFWDMMETAYEEVGFEIAGPISVEAFTMPTEGVVVIVTRVPSIPGQSKHEDDDYVSHAESDDSYDSTSVFGFKDFEDVVRVAHALFNHEIDAALYAYQDRYFMFIDEDSIRDAVFEGVSAILYEYGEYSEVTKAVLDEYGKRILEQDTINTLVEQFPLN